MPFRCHALASRTLVETTWSVPTFAYFGMKQKWIQHQYQPKLVVCSFENSERTTKIKSQVKNSFSYYFSVPSSSKTKPSTCLASHRPASLVIMATCRLNPGDAC